MGCYFSFQGHVTCQATNVHKGKNFLFQWKILFCYVPLTWRKRYVFLYMIAPYTELTNSLAMVKEC